MVALLVKPGGGKQKGLGKWRRGWPCWLTAYTGGEVGFEQHPMSDVTYEVGVGWMVLGRQNRRVLLTTLLPGWFSHSISVHLAGREHFCLNQNPEYLWFVSAYSFVKFSKSFPFIVIFSFFRNCKCFCKTLQLSCISKKSSYLLMCKWGLCLLMHYLYPGISITTHMIDSSENRRVSKQAWLAALR